MHSPLPANDLPFCREQLFWDTSQANNPPPQDGPKTLPRDSAWWAIPVKGPAPVLKGHFLCLKHEAFGKVCLRPII